MELFTYIDPKSFQSAWFWIMLSVNWSAICMRTLNVPYDMMVRGLNGDERAMAETELLASISARRNRGFYTTGGGGLWTGILFFLLAVSATFGFIYDYELAQGIFLILGPMMLVWVFAFRLSFRIQAQDLKGEALCRALIKRRFWNQVLGILVVVVAMIFMIIDAATQTVFGV